MFKNSTRVFVEDSIWGKKERKYIANYGTIVSWLQQDWRYAEGESFYDYTFGV